MKQTEMKPLSLLIKPAAGLCNMQCGYCFYCKASEGRENRIMTESTVDVLLDKIAAFRPSALSVVFQGGEPTLAGLDYFKYFTDKAKEKLAVPIHFALQTNGLLLDDSFAAFLKAHGFLVGISLDGGRKTNDRYRLDKNGQSVLPQVLAAIAILKKHEVDFNILSVIDNENAKEIESTYRYFKKHGFGYLQFIPYVDAGGDVSLSSEAYETFLKKVFDLWYADYMNGSYISVRHIDNYINMLLGNPPENCAMCGVCGNYFVVEADGALYPCDFYCTKEEKLGSIFDERPFEMGEKQRAFIEKSRIIHTHCSDCRYYALCRGGCRKDRTDGYTKNQYCKAYYHFFEYALPRMREVALLLRQG